MVSRDHVPDRLELATCQSHTAAADRHRDEFLRTPTLPLNWWEEAPILAGRDLQAGGTWLGVSRDGRLAALTNYRDPAHMRADAPPRGELVSNFYKPITALPTNLANLAKHAADYNRLTCWCLMDKV